MKQLSHSKCLKCIILFFLASASNIHQTRGFITEATEVIGVVKLGVSLVDYTYKVFSEIFHDHDANTSRAHGRSKDQELLDEYRVISASLERLGQSNEGVEITMKQLSENLPSVFRRELKLDRVDALIRSINNKYHTFEIYQKHKNEVERHSLEDFATSITSYRRGSVRQSLEELHSLIVPTSSGGVFGAQRGVFSMLAHGIQIIKNNVNPFFEPFNNYMTDADNISDNVLEDLAYSILEPGPHQHTSLQSALITLHNISMPGLGLTDSNGQLLGKAQRNDIFYKLFLALSQLIENGSNVGNLGQSPHQLLYNLYNIVALTEIKGYAMIQFSYMMLKLYNKGNFSFESELARKSFEAQATEKLMNVKGILPNLSRDFWMKDPSKHIEGQTYIRVTQLLQGILENEVDMNDKKSCKDKCSSYTVAETKDRCFKDLLCAKQRRCENGRLFDCQFFDADAWVCLSSNSEERRYDWVEYEDKTLLGTKGQCINKIKVDSWWRWLFWHCSYCLCKCDAPGPNSDRYLSLRPSVADDGKVVTGIRFVKKNRVIQMEIEQAEALAEGSVKEETRAWKENEAIDVNSAAKEGVDFMVMSYEQRALDTDLLEAPAGHVITGVKLRNIGGHINLEVQVTPISFTEGTLLRARSTWIGNDNTPATREVRKKVDILFPDVPTKFRGQSKIDSLQNQFIQFDSTSAYKDVSQTTIPFIDSQPVKPTTGTWLSGVGIYHKGRIGYGGYVGLIIKTFDFSRHLLPEMTQRNDNIGNSDNIRMMEELKFDFEKVKNEVLKDKQG